MTDTPATMKAWYATKRGTPAKVLQLKEDAPVPVPGPGEVIVKVHAAALNPIGHKLMSMLPSPLQRMPHIPEHDLAGTVVDPNGSALAPGTPVYGYLEVGARMRSRQGALAEYTRVPADGLVPIPSGVSFVQAAGLSLAGLTAFQGLFTIGRIEPGQHVFVNGGSTSVGAAAIQFAKAAGCRVAASASAKNEQFVRALGADEFVDYTAGPLHASLAALAPSPKYHVFFETVGLGDPILFARSEAYLAPGGVFVSVGPQPTGPANFLNFAWNVFLRPGFLGGARRKWKLLQVVSNKKDLDKFNQYVADGKVKPLVDSVYAFDDVLKAYERQMSGRATGKVVIKVDPQVE